MNAVLFDLDGTLVDTLADIACSANHALASHGRDALAVERFRAMVGDGARMLIARAAPDADEAMLESLLDAFRSHYLAHLLDRTRPYPGVEAMLAAFGERRVPLAVLSNKPDRATRAVVQGLLPAVPFAVVRGEREGVPRKPDPTAAVAIARELGIAPARCLFVGDSPVDIRTARAAGMTPVAVTWGFRSRAELAALGPVELVDEPAAVLACFEAARMHGADPMSR